MIIDRASFYYLEYFGDEKAILPIMLQSHTITDEHNKIRNDNLKISLHS